ncbi:MAG: prepilin peptidase [Candidatus Saccharimonadales bacterium]
MIILVLAVLGLCLGSFTNALVWRLHEQGVGSGKKLKKVPKQLTISQGRSVCPNCKHQLGFMDLIPVLSWIGLGGKCRYCHKPISWQYPLVELATAGLFILSYLCWPLGWSNLAVFQFSVWLVMLVGFMALTIYDLRWQLLPTRIIYPLGGLALLEVLVVAFISKDLAIIRLAAIGVLCLGGLFYLLFQLSGGKWIGYGDVRLGVVLGLLVGGPSSAVLLLFFASAIGTAASLPGLIGKKSVMKQRVAFGPFLILATVIVYLFGASIISWYKQRFLLL